MITTLKKWGNGQGIRISKDMMKMIGIESIEDKIKIEVNEGKIIIERVENEITIDKLFAEYDGEYQPKEYDFGKAEGREKW